MKRKRKPNWHNVLYRYENGLYAKSNLTLTNLFRDTIKMKGYDKNGGECGVKLSLRLLRCMLGTDGLANEGFIARAAAGMAQCSWDSSYCGRLELSCLQG